MNYYYKTYDPNVDFVTLAILIVFFFIFNSTFYNKSKKNNMFKFAIGTLFFATLINVIYMIMVTRYSYNNALVIYILRDITDCLLLATIVVYIRYLCSMFESSAKAKKLTGYFCTISLSIFNLLIVLSPLTHFGFYFDNNHAVHGDYLLDPFALGYVCYIMFITFQLLRYRKAMLNRAFRILVAIYFAVLLIMFLELTIESTTYLCFTYILPLLVVFSLFHSTSYDSENGTLDLQAFDDYLADLYKNKKEFYMMSLLFICNRDLTDFYRTVKKETFHFYEKIFVKSYAFQVDDKRFILIYQKTKIGNFVDSIKVFKKDFARLYETYQMDFKIVHLKSNHVLENDKNYLKYI